MMRDYEKLVLWLKDRTGIDLANYKSGQMHRRLTSLMESKGISNFQEYIKLLEADSDAFDEFFKRLTINVSDFFRNPERFEDLKRSILPRLLAERKHLKVWSAGCANGAEPYSLAMLLYELDPASFTQHEIIATDIDLTILAQARRGIYSESEMKGVSPQRRRVYFKLVGDRWRVRSFLRQQVKFFRHNLLVDPFPQGCDLILCRNVVIYFTNEAKTKLYPKLRASLRPGGVLMVGGTEPILRYQDFGFQQLGTGFYRRDGE